MKKFARVGSTARLLSFTLSEASPAHTQHNCLICDKSSLCGKTSRRKKKCSDCALVSHHTQSHDGGPTSAAFLYEERPPRYRVIIFDFAQRPTGISRASLCLPPPYSHRSWLILVSTRNLLRRIPHNGMRQRRGSRSGCQRQSSARRLASRLQSPAPRGQK